MGRFPSKCSACGEKAVRPVRLEHYQIDMDHDGRKYRVDVPDLEALQCSACNEIALDHDADIRISEAFRDTVGLLHPADLRAGRNRLGLMAKDVAAALGISDSTLSRWENGAQMQQRCMDKFLRAFFALPELRHFLGIQGTKWQNLQEVPHSLEPEPIVLNHFNAGLLAKGGIVWGRVVSGKIPSVEIPGPEAIQERNPKMTRMVA